MDIFLCNEHVLEPPDKDCMEDRFLDGQHGPCFAMIWAYDKGATKPFEAPAGSGFRVGPSTRFTTLLLQIHYQLPYDGLKAAALHARGYRDTSGVKVTLQARPRDVWSFAFMETNMAIPADARNAEYTSHMPAEAISHSLGHDITSAGGSIRLRLIHAHAHYHATAVSLHRHRHGQWEEIFKIDPYCGYGECQQFHELPEGTDVRQGDALQFRCRYDNTEGVVVHYGLSAAQEMCMQPYIHTCIDLGHCIAVTASCCESCTVARNPK